jgi:hypothetical protein
MLIKEAVSGMREVTLWKKKTKKKKRKKRNVRSPVTVVTLLILADAIRIRLTHADVHM